MSAKLDQALQAYEKESMKIVFVNGVFSSEKSELGPLQNQFYSFSKDDEVDKLTFYKSLHGDVLTTYKEQVRGQEGSFLFLEAQQNVDKPVHFIYFFNEENKKESCGLVNLVVSDSQGSVDILESFIGEDRINRHQVKTYLVQKEKSQVHFNQMLTGRLNLTNEVFVDLAEKSLNKVNVFSRSYGVIENHYVVDHNGPEGEASVKGFYFTDEKNQCLNKVSMNHHFEKGKSEQLFKSILLDSSKGSFEGRIFIDKKAQQVDSKQLNHNLVLGERAEAESLPILEIYADDVKANHGSTMGFLDKESLFYLMSRGISKAKAVELVSMGYALETVEEVQSEGIKGFLTSSLKATMSQVNHEVLQERGFDV